MKKIIFVHGFGVLKDARGMFSEIESCLKEENYECVLFNLNDLSPEGHTLVNGFSEQVSRLKNVWLRKKIILRLI